jgi:hypothetical protein
MDERSDAPSSRSLKSVGREGVTRRLMATRRRRVAASPTTRPTDYLTVPVGEIGKIRSVLTMLGGRIVFADDAFAGLLAK